MYPNLCSPFIGKKNRFQNKVVMAAMTRCRADRPGIPNDIMVQYYDMRGDCGLIFTECSAISPLGNCFPGSGGIWSEEMMEGAKICLQIWHCGRCASNNTLNGETPICSSPVKNRFSPSYPVPREMSIEDIELVLEQFYQGAVNAKKAGFDMIELHGANGYLIDQFLRDDVNQRQDEYGGSIENRCRFPLQVLSKLCKVYAPQNVGIKLSPVGRFNDMFDSDPVTHYTYLIKQLNKMQIGFIEVMEATEFYAVKMANYPSGEEQMPDVCSILRPLFNGIYIANNSISPQKGEEMVRTGKCDLVSFARYFISNPDFVDRLKNNLEFNEN